MHDLRVIDADGHVDPEYTGALDWEKAVEEPYKGRAPKRLPFRAYGARTFIEGRLLERTYPEDGEFIDRNVLEVHVDRRGMVDPHLRMKDMDKEGIDVSVLFGSGHMYLGASTLEDAKLAAALARAYNNWMADYARPYPTRLKNVGGLATQDPGEAVKELDRLVRELGFVGVALPTNVHGKDLDHPHYHPMFREAESLGVPVCTHMAAGLAGSGIAAAGTDRLRKHAYVHMVAHPFEAMIAIGCVTMGGVLDRFPRLRFAFLEGGCGWLPFWMQRMDEHYEMDRPVLAAKAKPSEYIRDSGQVYVSCEADEVALEFVVSAVGEDRILYASDYWHYDAKFFGSVAAIQGRRGLTDTAKRKLLGENAARLYRL